MQNKINIFEFIIKFVLIVSASSGLFYMIIFKWYKKWFGHFRIYHYFVSFVVLFGVAIVNYSICIHLLMILSLPSPTNIPNMKLFLAIHSVYGFRWIVVYPLNKWIYGYKTWYNTTLSLTINHVINIIKFSCLITSYFVYTMCVYTTFSDVYKEKDPLNLLFGLIWIFWYFFLLRLEYKIYKSLSKTRKLHKVLNKKPKNFLIICSK